MQPGMVVPGSHAAEWPGPMPEGKNLKADKGEVAALLFLGTEVPARVHGNCSQRQAAGLKGFQRSLLGLADPSEDPLGSLVLPRRGSDQGGLRLPSALHARGCSCGGKNSSLQPGHGRRGQGSSAGPLSQPEPVLPPHLPVCAPGSVQGVSARPP